MMCGKLKPTCVVCLRQRNTMLSNEDFLSTSSDLIGQAQRFSIWNLEPVFWAACLTGRIPLCSAVLGPAIRSPRLWALGGPGGERPTYPTLRGSPSVGRSWGSALGISASSKDGCLGEISLCSPYEKRCPAREAALSQPLGSDLLCYFALSTRFMATSSNRILWAHLLCSLYL